MTTNYCNAKPLTFRQDESNSLLVFSHKDYVMFKKCNITYVYSEIKEWLFAL